MSITSIGTPGGFDPVKMADEFFKKADTNADGGIDKSELQAMMSKGSGGSAPAADVDKAFAEADANGDGKIDQTENANQLKKISEEMQSRLGQAGGPPAGGAPPSGGGGGAASAAASGNESDSKYYDPADTNKDGVVSPEEKLAYAAKHPESKPESNDQVKSAVDDLMKQLENGTKYGQQGTLGVGTSGTQGLFSLFA